MDVGSISKLKGSFHWPLRLHLLAEARPLYNIFRSRLRVLPDLFLVHGSQRAVRNDDLPVDDDHLDVSPRGRIDDRADGGEEGLEVNFPHINDDEISLLPDLQAANRLFQAEGLGPVYRRHLQDGLSWDDGGIAAFRFMDDGS
mgnify:CR=1 FL=1